MQWNLSRWKSKAYLPWQPKNSDKPRIFQPQIGRKIRILFSRKRGWLGIVSEKSVDLWTPTSYHKQTCIDFGEGGNWMTEKTLEYGWDRKKLSPYKTILNQKAEEWPLHLPDSPRSTERGFFTFNTQECKALIEKCTWKFLNEFFPALLTNLRIL